MYTLAKYRGMGEAVKSLRSAGIISRLQTVDPAIKDLGDVDCPIIEQDHGPENLQNFDEFLEGTRNVQDKMSKRLDSSRLAFLLGGECSFIVGSTAALKTLQKGRPGIVWMDAHGDYNTPETTDSGFIGGMCLAMACGRGPTLTSDLESSRPLIDPERVVHIGSRSLDPGEDKALENSVKLITAKQVKKEGIRKVARQTAKHLSDSCDWIIAHLDVDVFDPSVMRSVDFPEPGGLTDHDILQVFDELHHTGKLMAIDLTAYNPSMDKDGKGRSFLLELAPRLVAVPRTMMIKSKQAALDPPAWS